MIRAGDDHSAAIDAAGRLYVWGNGTNGQLGLGNMSDRLSPTVLELGDEVVEIELGAVHSIALTKRGRVWVWGTNTNNQLGTDGGDSNVPVELTFGDTSVNFGRAACSRWRKREGCSGTSRNVRRTHASSIHHRIMRRCTARR